MSLTSASSSQAFGARDGLSSTVSEPLLPEQLASQEYFDPVVEPSPKTGFTGKRFTVYLALIGALIVVVVLAVVLPIYFVVIKPKSHVDATSAAGATSSSGTSSGGGNGGSSGGVIVSITVSSRFYVSNESIVSSMATMDLWLPRIMARNSPIIIRLKDIV